MLAKALARRLRLTVLTDAGLAAPRTLEDVVAAALSAGAPAIQLREKGSSARELFAVGSAVRRLTREAGALFIVNDRLDLALALDADGIHLGPHDLPVSAVRSAVGEGFLVGRSASDPMSARAAVAAGADYVGCGAVYETVTKADPGDVIGLDGLDRVARSVEVPVVGIGGITANRAVDVARTAAVGVAVVSAVMRAADVDAAVRGLMAPWRDREGPGGATRLSTAEGAKGSPLTSPPRSGTPRSRPR